ncbi:peptidoglycan glycosyltransferase [Trichlorobacter thiogenes]|uniref:Peptidoglycan glycosyltransferase n=1 Tax=Trichlorobacter thiogenes TaxID=115783 RepID=A0A1T4NDU0_9BACT|nr:penicillin-binding protein 2 [Trichlorobacter thiogenes]SJZ77511.1 peptidoglycan glycosyltransferase [Trichlorobacter thiogenes]
MIKGQRYVRELAQPRQRTIPLAIVVTVLFFLLLLRLWYLQIIKVDDYRTMSENNRLRFLPVAASRGALMDRNGTVMVNNRPSFSLSIIPQEVKDVEGMLDRLAALLKLDRAELQERWEKTKGRARYYPVVIAVNITQDQVEIVEENRLRLPGVEVSVKPIREYAFQNSAAHLLGYIGEVSDKELDAPAYSDYNPGDYVGKNGIEKAWEKELHGSDGGRQLEVDSRGRVLRVLSESSPTVGNSLVLTVDSRLQRTAEQAFGGQAGAAVVMNVNNGEVLAFVSSPTFDPSLFAGRIPADIWKKYLEDKRHPLENKALAGQYPPGSTFKMLTALAGLEAGVINENTTVHCDGAYEMGGSKFRCWSKSGHGSVNLRKSLKESCDVYYYHLGEKLGVDRIAAMAERFMLGKELGIGLQNEKKGLVPSTAWKLKRFGKKWFPGETLPVAIGQGYVLMTPIQLASMVATVANEGTIYRPHLVKKVVDPDGKTIKEFTPETIGTTGIAPASFKKVKQGLYAVVNDPGGTGANARLWDQKVAGKTGTSQVVKLGEDRKKARKYEHMDHGLFVAFAPYDKPEVAVAVVVEHGGGGGAVAAPIAGKILRSYFDLQKPPPKQKPAEKEEQEPAETPVKRQEMPAERETEE